MRNAVSAFWVASRTPSTSDRFPVCRSSIALVASCCNLLTCWMFSISRSLNEGCDGSAARPPEDTAPEPGPKTPCPAPAAPDRPMNPRGSDIEKHSLDQEAIPSVACIMPRLRRNINHDHLGQKSQCLCHHRLGALGDCDICLVRPLGFEGVELFGHHVNGGVL